ncbi:dihydrofolate reductase [Clostridium sp. DJ247]|uniref:dihydrofolate reductase n=1 Tax=Clostridium sp. DJ247 TaxID=2726188 RepID=UPI00162A1C51|nr:dihydrofolate reductase [Clostridium sp. DJ247]MBC2581044.1 dihydrofolate reductase [Clostridium sp. DJ247]
MLSYVVAIANNRVIGKDNKLPWHLPEDLKRFKEITTSGTKTIIMGRKTFESLPKKLPNRKHIVITRNKDYKIGDEEVTIINDLKYLENMIGDYKEYFVIGGAEIFSELFPYSKKMYITRIYEDFQGDTFFPYYNEEQWCVVHSEEGIVNRENKFEHKFITLERK